MLWRLGLLRTLAANASRKAERGVLLYSGAEETTRFVEDEKNTCFRFPELGVYDDSACLSVVDEGYKKAPST